MNKALLSKCDDCELNSCPFVPSAGPKRAELVIVGEAPGSNEVLEGIPFAARLEGKVNAGYILWESLRQLDVAREDVFVTNVCLCRPPSNRQPTPSEVRCCFERLQAEIFVRQSKLVLMLGNSALHALTGTRQGITAARMYNWDLACAPGAIGIATFHPAALLRQGDLFNDFAGDVEDAIARLRGATGRRASVDLDSVIVTTIDELRANIATIPPETQIAVDIETSGFNPRSDYVLCITVAWAAKAFVIVEELLSNAVTLGILNKLLRTHKQLYHNGKFDVAFLRALGLSNARIDDDSMLMSYALDERQGIHGLKDLSHVYLGAPDYEQELKTYLPNKKVSYAEIPTAVLYRYAGLDAHYTSRLGEHLKEKLVDGIDRAYNGVLIPGVNALLKVESYGLLVDTKYLEELRAMYTVQTAALENKLERWGGSGFNPRSPQQVSEVLTKLALCPPGTGTDKEILEGLRHDFPRTLLEYRKVMKKLATYVEGITKFIEPNGRVYPSYLLHGTVTGRLSSTKPAIHTIPRDPEVRNLFIAPPGYTLLAADYDQHEWRVVAFYSGDEKLVEIFEQGRKLHGEVAEELYGKGFDHEDYMRAKMVNFGILYGRGEYSLSLQLGVSTAEAAGYIERFFERMPRVRKFLQSASATAVRTGELQTVFGRKRRFGLVSEGNYIDVKKQANNFHAQSTASDITMLSMAKLVNELPEEDARCVASIHDALLWEVRESKVSEIQNRIVEVMEAYPQELLNTTVPFKTEIKIGTRWGDLEKIK